ncbi:OLC1v1007118C2 [Oldenlandia corymbosa var. corymbosa]|uniref:OLC1v1007118C2 n=1 Tax=Oldenlandia corymbosa var. corymbosa TaxID=529605 RepID=A0AAV1DIK5_OLDCO|nr:OLC1v1007118C2 [Oldenlandia corymbosa var. corymbosa]
MASEERRKGFLAAASSGCMKQVKRFAKRLQNLDEVEDAEGRTALHFAAAGGHTAVCDHLIKKLKLGVNVKDAKGNTPLIVAIDKDQTATALYLIETGGADIMMFNQNGLMPLHCAALRGNTEVLQLLISNGAVIETGSKFGTPLQCAVTADKKEAVKILLDNLANPNLVAGSFASPLMLSIAHDSLDCFLLLLEAGAIPDLPSSLRRTPLNVAAFFGKTEIIKYLLKSGANPDVTDAYGLTALEHAAVNGKVEAIKILFPVTSRIPSFPDWSIDGIMVSISSADGRKKITSKMQEIFRIAKANGLAAFKEENYAVACTWFSAAVSADPDDASVLSNRSLCFLRLNNGDLALADAEKCVSLKPNWAKAHYREGAAWMFLDNYSMATKAFAEALKLEPDNVELKKAHAKALLMLNLVSMSQRI